MKAINRNGVIYTYNYVPSEFEGNNTSYVAGFNSLSEEEQRAEGLYDLFTPEYNANTHEKGPIEWDTHNQRFIYTIVEKTFSKTIEQMKSDKIQNLNSNLERKLETTDWAYTRKLDTGQAVPSHIQNERNALRVAAEAKEIEIGFLETKSAIADYDITL